MTNPITNNKFSLSGLNEYLKQQGIKQPENYNIGELFTQCDKFDEKNNEVENGDGFLNKKELEQFLDLVKSNCTDLYENIKAYGRRFFLIMDEDDRKDLYAWKTENSSVCRNDALYVAPLPETKALNTNIVKNIHFKYDEKTEKALEYYICNEAETHDGKGKITYFKRIPEIRSMPENERSERDKRLLEEYDNMIKMIKAAAYDYDVDPRYIVAIIQRETGFQGTNYDADGKKRKNVSEREKAGCGYMQLDDITEVEILEGFRNLKTGKDSYTTNGVKTARFGNELAELLESRNFKTDCKASEKPALFRKIRDYIKTNNDPEFNIRLGTLFLRVHLKNTKGDFKKAALRYNGGGDSGYGVTADYLEKILECESKIS
ncbi:hypothetical protein IKQ21_01305 [bacterium]|nr:hypothetical protein [bacterium]